MKIKVLDVLHLIKEHNQEIQILQWNDIDSEGVVLAAVDCFSNKINIYSPTMEKQQIYNMYVQAIEAVSGYESAIIKIWVC